MMAAAQQASCLTRQACTAAALSSAAQLDSLSPVSEGFVGDPWLFFLSHTAFCQSLACFWISLSSHLPKQEDSFAVMPHRM
jgi:hypothetical protein